MTNLKSAGDRFKELRSELNNIVRMTKAAKLEKIILSAEFAYELADALDSAANMSQMTADAVKDLNHALEHSR